MMFYFLYAFAAFYALWCFYIIVMALKRVKDTIGLTMPMKVLGYPLLFVGLTLDWLVNVIIFSVLFWELPAQKWELVTGRLKRHAYADHGWRTKVAKWFGPNLLDPFDPAGRHI
jgi:hypothetical protein